MSDEVDARTNTEYSGRVGYEKKLRQTHWGIDEKVVLKDGNYDTGYEWVLVGQRYKLLPKKRATRDTEATDGKEKVQEERR